MSAAHAFMVGGFLDWERRTFFQGCRPGRPDGCAQGAIWRQVHAGLFVLSCFFREFLVCVDSELLSVVEAGSAFHGSRFGLRRFLWLFQ